jgi:hypothetical protein
MLVRKRGESASSGTGTMISTLLAVERRLNCAFAYPYVRQTPLFALPVGKNDLQHVLDSRARVRLDHALYPDERLDLRVQPVAHKLKLSIGGNERDRSIILKSRQPNTLVEFDILHFDSLSSARPSSILEHDFVVQS